MYWHCTNQAMIMKIISQKLKANHQTNFQMFFDPRIFKCFLIQEFSNVISFTWQALIEFMLFQSCLRSALFLELLVYVNFI